MQAENNDQPKISSEHKALLSRFNSQLEKRRKKLEPRVKDWRKWRDYLRGKNDVDKDTGAADPDEVRTNLLLGIAQTLQPLLYAKDPEFSVTPQEKLETQDYPALKQFCKTIELVVTNQLVRRGKLKKAISKNIVSALSAPVAWFKISYQKEWSKDPVMIGRLSDAQDNLAEVEKLIRQIDKADAGHEAKKAELQEQIKALEAQVDVVLQEGIIVDRDLCENIIILDDSLQSFSDYAEAQMIVHIVPMSSEDYQTRFGKKPTGTEFHSKDTSKSEPGKDKETTFIYVCEGWSKKDSTVYTWPLGGHEWAREPYQPEKVGERFYPFFALAFNDLDGDDMPVPDVSQWISMQDEYIRMRTQQSQARQENKPGWMYRMGGSVTDKDLEAISNRKGRQYVGVQGNGATGPLSDDLMPFPTFQIDPAVYDPTPIVRDLEQAAGVSDASRGMILSSKTATEAEIAQSGQASRTSFRVDLIEELIKEMGIYTAQLCLFHMTLEQVEKITGKGAVWPQMSRDDIYSLVDIEVVAGSTGKPNQRKEQETWGKLVPEIVNTVTQVAQMKQQGMMQEAKTLEAILKETLKRYDQRMDLTEFGIGENAEQLPMMPPMLPSPDQAAMGAAPPISDSGSMPPPETMPPPADTGVPLQSVMLDFGKIVADGQSQMANALGQFAAVQSQADQANAQSLAGSSEAMAAISEQIAGMLQAISTQQEQTAQAIQAIEQSIRIAAAPKIPMYGPNGKITAVVPNLS